MSLRVFRIIIPVSDIEKAACFYGAVFGALGERVSDGRHYFNLGGVIFACYDPRADGDERDAMPNPEYVYISVGDLDALHARIQSLPFSRVTGIRHQPWGERSVYTTDLFGNRICFIDEATLFTGLG